MLTLCCLLSALVCVGTVIYPSDHRELSCFASFLFSCIFTAPTTISLASNNNANSSSSTTTIIACSRPFSRIGERGDLLCRPLPPRLRSRFRLHLLYLANFERSMWGVPRWGLPILLYSTIARGSTAVAIATAAVAAAA